MAQGPAVPLPAAQAPTLICCGAIAHSGKHGNKWNQLAVYDKHVREDLAVVGGDQVDLDAGSCADDWHHALAHWDNHVLGVMVVQAVFVPS